MKKDWRLRMKLSFRQAKSEILQEGNDDNP